MCSSLSSKRSIKKDIAAKNAAPGLAKKAAEFYVSKRINELKKFYIK